MISLQESHLIHNPSAICTVRRVGLACCSAFLRLNHAVIAALGGGLRPPSDGRSAGYARCTTCLPPGVARAKPALGVVKSSRLPQRSLELRDEISDIVDEA